MELYVNCVSVNIQFNAHTINCTANRQINAQIVLL